MSYAKSKGTLFETQIVKYLQGAGFDSARRVALAGKDDKGDIHLGPANHPIFVIECKNYAKELPYGTIENFVEEAHREYENISGGICSPDKRNYSALLFVKRVNLGVADSWVIWKNSWGITIRCRLGDLIDQKEFSECYKTEEERFSNLRARIQDGYFVPSEGPGCISGNFYDD